jgi:type I restriction-modification system DNA methylase subunit
VTEVPKIIYDLVERFERDIDYYKSSGYKEEQLKQEFLNPFFEALGWDVYNKRGFAPQYRDVIFEDSIKMASGVRAPDYCFTLAGKRKFFVEAKKPSVNIKMEFHPSFQLRRYAWTAKLSLSILTDFEEFAIYESRKRPTKNDRSDTERLEYYTYRDYIDKWEKIANIFSKDAVYQGFFDKFTESAKKKRGTQEVDDEFLNEIESWRELLAKNIAFRNPSLDCRELNYAVQQTIDRIIFLRMCEDRGIENYGQLRNLIVKKDIYGELCKIYKKADEKYNSGLFHFKKEKERNTSLDELTLGLDIDNKTLITIFKHLYYPDSPYEFSVLSSEILGNVYERFLGKIIRLTEGHHAKVEEKPEVKKAGGVYYTPEYVVNYIVENTIGKLCIGKTPEEITEIRIIDPACGSGSFLLGAYSYLLQYHLSFYLKKLKSKRYRKRIYEGEEEEWFLTIEEKRRILLNNIFGVDIDPQAVEVTKLSLLLKVLEGVKSDRLEIQKKFDIKLRNQWRARALPDLGNNIKCGNSIISPNYNQSIQTKILDIEEVYKLNIFDWKSEFENISDNGGFDVIIGNPPYRMLQPHNTTKEILEYLRNNFFAADFKIDFFHLFLQKGIDLLKEKNGYLGYIVPVTLLNNVYIKSLRKFISEKCKIESISVANEKVFKADVHTCILILNTESDVNKRNKNNILTTINFNNSFANSEKKKYQKIKQNDFSKLFGNIWNVLINNENSKLLFKLINNHEKLGDIAQINRGLITGNRKKYFSNTKDSKFHIPIIAGADVHRYYFNEPSEYVLFDRPESAGGCWDEDVHKAPHKIAVRQIGKRPTACILREPLAVTGNIFTIKYGEIDDEIYILGIINSKLMQFFWKIMFTDFKTSFPQVTIFSLSQIPIFLPSDCKKTKPLITLVNKEEELYRQLNSSRTPNEQEIIQRQINNVNKQIDLFIYDLYGLSKDEIKLIENTS